MNDAAYDDGPGLVEALRIENPQKIPAARYYDPNFFQLEATRLWPRAWQMACRLEQIPEPGDWVDYTILGKSVIVVRTENGVRAFHNHCRHRGVKLTDTSHGNCKGKGFICPFHGWRWDLNGNNSFVYGRHLFTEALLERGDLALRPCRVELFGGCAFINFDDRAPSYRETIGPVAASLEAHGLDDLRVEWWVATELPANWKLAMEAFMEGYHVMRTHPQLQHIMPDLYNARYGRETGDAVIADTALGVRENIDVQLKHLELLNAGMAGMVQSKEIAIAAQLRDAPLPADPAQALPAWFRLVRQAITEELRKAGENVPDLNAVAASHPVHAVEFLFPNYFLLPFFSSMSSYRIRPLGPERCLFELWSLTHYPPGQAPEAPREPKLLPFDSELFPMIPRQDYANIPQQQLGLHSEGFDFMRLSGKVEGLISNYQRLIDGYLEGRPGAQLAAANRKLGGNFDGPVCDLGF